MWCAGVAWREPAGLLEKPVDTSLRFAPNARNSRDHCLGVRSRRQTIKIGWRQRMQYNFLLQCAVDMIGLGVGVCNAAAKAQVGSNFHHQKNIYVTNTQNFQDEGYGVVNNKYCVYNLTTL